jgi:hypothetical protein
MTEPAAAVRPAEVCRGLLAALDAAEGRRKRRRRDTTPDAIGLGIKRTLLDAAVRDDPDPDAFEGWLFARILDGTATDSAGAVRAMALEILLEWRLTGSVGAFQRWLASGAPSDDARAPARPVHSPDPERSVP